MTLTWRDALNQFEQHLRESGLAQNTVTNYLLDLRGFVAWLQQAENGLTPASFSSTDVAAYKQHLHESLARSPASTNRNMQSLRKFGRFAQTAGLQQSNPAQEVPLLAYSSQSTLQVLTPEQVQHLIEIAAGRNSRTAARDRAILHLLVHAGLRAGEVILLQVNDVNFARDMATLTIREQGKTTERHLPLNTATRIALQNYLDQKRLPDAGCSYLFRGRRGAALSIRSVQQIVASLGKAAGLNITAKLLRDTYARELWRTSADLNLLMRRLGVRRPETALKYIIGEHNGIRSQ